MTRLTVRWNKRLSKGSGVHGRGICADTYRQLTTAKPTLSNVILLRIQAKLRLFPAGDHWIKVSHVSGR